MGGQSSQTQQQQSSTQPWAAAQPAMQGILQQLEGQIGNTNLTGAETGALNTLQQNASAGNPYATQIRDYAINLLNGGGANAQAGNIQGGLDAFKTQMSPFASADYSSLSNPQLQAALQQIQDDVTNNVRGQFAAGGRSFSPSESMAIGRGVSAAQAPLILDQFNKDQALRTGAATSLYDAQNATGGLLANLGQQDLANRGMGVSAAQSALDAQNYGANSTLAIEAQRRGIPAQALGLLAQIGTPIAGLGSQTSGTTTTTKQDDPTRAIIGAAIGGLGLLSGNPMAGMGGLSSLGGMFGSGGMFGAPQSNPWMIGSPNRIPMAGVNFQ